MENNLPDVDVNVHTSATNIASGPPSPLLLAQQLELGRKRDLQEIKLAEQKYSDEWSTCCSRSGRTDRRLIQFSVKFILSMAVLGFAGVQLATAGPCDSQTSFYSSLFTFVLGAWFSDARPGFVSGTKKNNT